MRKTSLIKFIFVLMFLVGTRGVSAGQEAQPTIAKDSVQVTAFTFSVYRKNYDVWSWAPKINYRVNGPIDSGSQLYVEFNLPGSGPWVKFDCKTSETQKGFRWDTECLEPPDRVRLL